MEPRGGGVEGRYRSAPARKKDANVLTGAHAVLPVILGLLGARQRHLQSRVVEETLVVRGVQWCGADVSPPITRECLVGSDDTLVGAPNRQYAPPTAAAAASPQS